MHWEDDEFDAEEGEGDATVPCPYCREPIHEDSQRCPHCEQYISQEDAPPARKAPWIVIGVLACLVIVAIWIIRS
jgi:predicted nucleic acid-binding Zn ribbon protein